MFKGFLQVQLVILTVSSDGEGEPESSAVGMPTEHGNAHAHADGLPKASRTKYFLSAAQLEQRRKAGLARAKAFTKEYQSAAGKARARAFTSEYQSQAWLAKLAKLGAAHLSEIGKRGWLAAIKAQPDFYERGGETSRLRYLARYKAKHAQLSEEPAPAPEEKQEGKGEENKEKPGANSQAK